MKKVEQRVEQLDTLIRLELEHLDLYCRDWALWTDTWKFVQDGNSEYKDSNLGEESLKIGELSFFFFFNIEGDLISASWFDPETGSFFKSGDGEMPLSFKNLLFTERDVNTEHMKIGFIRDLSGDWVYLFSSRTILKSDISGPAAGTLIAGRVMDETMLLELGNTFQMPLVLLDRRDTDSIALRTSLGVPYELRRTSAFSREPWSVVFPLKLFIPEDGRSLNFLHYTDIIHEGMKSVIAINIIVIFIFLMLLWLYNFLVSKIVIRPILELINYVEQKCILFNTDEEGFKRKPNEIAQLSMRFHFLLEKLTNQNKNLSVKAQTDGLTGLDRREPLLERLNAVCSRCDSDGLQTVSVLMIDIDHFKRINDTWGHPVGDEVIKGIAPVLRSCLREGDVVGRYGGEEFLIVLKDLSSEIVLVLAERIRFRVEQSQWSFGGTVTVSIGYSIKGCPCESSELIEDADSYLYSAKHNGRNRIEGFEVIPSGKREKK
ncbi:MAG: diguanylate cyclase [Spirochaetales bacterium]|nr:diguanylate cyclase [Spirochaetales bacterium]